LPLTSLAALAATTQLNNCTTVVCQNTVIVELQVIIVSWVNVGKSAASFCHQVAAWFPDMFSNLYLVKNHKNC
jgi:hypothetical protein